MEKIRVLVVDDSVVVRRVVTEELAAQPDLAVAGTASTGRIALSLMDQTTPDLVILDVEMPDMDGLTALSHIRKSHPKTPVIMFSALTELGAAATLEALSLGAADFFTKPSGPGGLEESRLILRSELIPAIRALCARNLSPAKAAPAARVRSANNARIDLLAIGASTGGPNALAELFLGLPPDFPVPILIVQHMPPMFTRLLAERLSKNSEIPTVEATAGVALTPGKAWIAPGDYHLEVVRQASHLRTHIHQEPRENSCRPAVDPLFRSAAKACGPNCLAVVLTGMGQDGLRGCEALRAAGSQILTQDESTSVVWGMPGFVTRAGLADKVVPLPMLAREIIRRAGTGRG
jgi:two-component system chemotaxis response regulator CheB